MNDHINKHSYNLKYEGVGAKKTSQGVHVTQCMCLAGFVQLLFICGHGGVSA